MTKAGSRRIPTPAAPGTIGAQLAALLKAELAEGGFYQADMARALGISQKHMSMVLTGKSAMSDELWFKAADLLGMRWVVNLYPKDKVGG